MSRKYTEIEMLSDEIFHHIGRGNLELCQTVLTHRNRHREKVPQRKAHSVPPPPEPYRKMQGDQPQSADQARSCPFAHRRAQDSPTLAAVGCRS